MHRQKQRINSATFGGTQKGKNAVRPSSYTGPVSSARYNAHRGLTVQHFPMVASALLPSRGGWLALAMTTLLKQRRHRVGGLPCTAYCTFQLLHVGTVITVSFRDIRDNGDQRRRREYD